MSDKQITIIGEIVTTSGRWGVIQRIAKRKFIALNGTLIRHGQMIHTLVATGEPRITEFCGDFSFILYTQPVRVDLVATNFLQSQKPGDQVYDWERKY